MGKHEGWEGSVDDEVVLVSLYWAGLGGGALADLWLGGTESAEGGEDGGESKGFDFNGNGGPTGEEALLEFAVI